VSQQPSPVLRFEGEKDCAVQYPESSFLPDIKLSWRNSHLHSSLNCIWSSGMRSDYKMVCFGHSLVVFDFSYGLTQDCRLVCQNVWTPCV